MAIYTVQATNLTLMQATLKDTLLRCELNFTDVAAVLVTAVSSAFSAAIVIKTVVTAEILMRQQ